MKQAFNYIHKREFTRFSWVFIGQLMYTVTLDFIGFLLSYTGLNQILPNFVDYKCARRYLMQRNFDSVLLDGFGAFLKLIKGIS